MLERVQELRKQMVQFGVHGYLIPMADGFGSEYVPECDNRLQYITGFTGSAGFAIVMENAAAFFTDGRYTLQAPKEVDGEVFDIFNSAECSPVEWLQKHARTNYRIGFDAHLFSENALLPYSDLEEKNDFKFVSVRKNLIDKMWKERPQVVANEVTFFPKKYSGKGAKAKLEELSAVMTAQDADAYVVCNSETINWLLNIRGSDLPCTPTARAHAIVSVDGKVDLFADPSRFTPNVLALMGDNVSVLEPHMMVTYLKRLARQRVMIDPATCVMEYIVTLTQANARLVRQSDPCALPRACKNEIELEGIKEAHIKDGAALVQFMHWFDQFASAHKLTELSVVEKLEDFRWEQEEFQGISFDTIAGYGANGAIVHYRATEATNKLIRGDNLLLLDSGGQYLGGTTDVTRTILVGSPTKKQVEHYTLVLKGHIALGSAIFPEGTTGHQLDVLARNALWQEGLDYAHGTGHGVGHYLNVHEGPQGISTRANNVALKEGMVLSNEPGFYRAGKYGIRIENLVAVMQSPVKADEKTFLTFETLTLAPFERKLIDVNLLSEAEVDWVNRYHQKVWLLLSERLHGDAKNWLEGVTQPL